MKPYASESKRVSEQEMYAHDRMLNMKNARNNNNNINIISALENSRYCVAYNNKKNNKMPIAFGQSWRVEEKST